MGEIEQLELNQIDRIEWLLYRPPARPIKATDISKRAHRKLLQGGVKVKYRAEHKLKGRR